MTWSDTLPLRNKLRTAATGAKIVSSSFVLMTMLRRMRIDEHPAHWIAHAIFGLIWFVIAMIVGAMARRMLVMTVFRSVWAPASCSRTAASATS